MFKSIIKFFECVGRRRAASQFIRMGRPDLAKAVMICN